MEDLVDVGVSGVESEGIEGICVAELTWLAKTCGAVAELAVASGLIWTTSIVLVMTTVLVTRWVTGGAVTYMVWKDVFGGDVFTTVTMTGPVGEFPGPGPEPESEPEPEPDPPESPELPDPPGPEPPSIGTTE